jgi:hypothetical protein
LFASFRETSTKNSAPTPTFHPLHGVKVGLFYMIKNARVEPCYVS